MHKRGKVNTAFTGTLKENNYLPYKNDLYPYHIQIPWHKKIESIRKSLLKAQ
jgi:hypothetical protein